MRNKTCINCKKLKNTSEFAVANRANDGLCATCKICDKLYSMAPLELRKIRRKESVRLYWENNKARLNKIQKGLLHKLRLDFIQAYGGKCTCCGEDNWEFLTVEHVGGGGSRERKTMSTYQLMVHLKNIGYPKGRYDILCMNCNFARAYRNGCPHTHRGKHNA